jgi:radical SAM protein with 4Fe4S-binding SPASM domain
MIQNLKSLLRLKMRKYPYLRFCIKSAQNFLQNKDRIDRYWQDSLLCLDTLDFNRMPEKSKFPTGSNIEITNACNLNCLMCNTKMQERPYSSMKPEVFERIILQLKETGIKTAGLHTVGETFVYKNLETLFEIAERHDFTLWISTNGHFPERIEEIHRKFPKILNDIRISVDGASKETFERIRVGGSFDKVIESFEVIHRLNRGKQNFKIGVTLDSILNMDTVYELPLYFERFGKYVAPESINFWVVTGLSPNSSYFRETFPFPNLIRSEVPCDMPFNSQYFTYDGKATMCCRDYNGEITVGGIMDTSLKDIWDGESAEKVREQHRNPETLSISACQKCYGPHKFVQTVTNNFIHYLYFKMPGLSNEEMGNSLVSLFEGMDEAMKTKDIPALKTLAAAAFQSIDTGNSAPPKTASEKRGSPANA